LSIKSSEERTAGSSSIRWTRFIHFTSVLAPDASRNGEARE
jgi:hypothetical protein